VSVACFAVIFCLACGVLAAAGALWGAAGQLAAFSVMLAAALLATLIRVGGR
jgi:hypothetical protein